MNTCQTQLKNEHSYVSEIMQKDVITIYEGQSIYDASVLMTNKNVGMLLVVKQDNTLIGTITDRDIVTHCISQKKDTNKTKVKDCITQYPCRGVPSMSCQEAMSLMAGCGLRRLPIVKNGDVLGIVSIADMAKLFAYCPNTKCQKEDCILIDLAKSLQRTSHLVEETTSQQSTQEVLPSS
jgi:predicted transcriptional regulator